jgi:hypothetical protein
MGTNGGTKLSGTTTVLNGNLYTPRSGVGNCTTSNVTAETISGGATLNGTLVNLPQQWIPPTPLIVPVTAGTADVSVSPSSACSAFGLSSPATCVQSTETVAGTVYTLFTINPNGSTISWKNVSISNQVHVTLDPGQYHLNTLSLSQNNTVLNIGDGTAQGDVHMTLVGSSASTTVNVGSGSSLVVPSLAGGTLIMDLMTSDQSNNVPISAGGNGGISNLSYDPKKFQINYAGTNQSSIAGGSSAAFLMNSPNADLKLTGGSEFFGSLIVKNLDDTGGTNLHYDRNLASNFGIGGVPILTSFSWKRF